MAPLILLEGISKVYPMRSHTVSAEGGAAAVARDDDSGAGRNARISDVVVHETGTWRFLVRTRNKLHRYGRYEVRVRQLD